MHWRDTLLPFCLMPSIGAIAGTGAQSHAAHHRSTHSRESVLLRQTCNQTWPICSRSILRASCPWDEIACGCVRAVACSCVQLRACAHA
eukprot:6173742-Pleurochrysis_carterae.AAC.5